jgi:(4-(4-[2-(gamma-L-glutamylamino)ethyl]phenoxymethyl)furan-2-yl)methanamine synthase
MVTADGREKTIEASRARLARMVGCDASDADDTTWHQLARWFAESQTRAVTDAAMLVTSACTMAPAPIVGAGVGLTVVAEVARRLRCACTSFHELFDVAPEARIGVSHCAPAAALAGLAS